MQILQSCGRPPQHSRRNEEQNRSVINQIMHTRNRNELQMFYLSNNCRNISNSSYQMENQWPPHSSSDFLSVWGGPESLGIFVSSP
jgi:hypothetical protein